jgi:WD40 repeat protein
MDTGKVVASGNYESPIVGMEFLTADVLVVATADGRGYFVTAMSENELIDADPSPQFRWRNSAPHPNPESPMNAIENRLIAASTDGQYLIVATPGGVAKVYSVVTKKPKAALTHDFIEISNVDFLAGTHKAIIRYFDGTTVITALGSESGKNSVVSTFITGASPISNFDGSRVIANTMGKENSLDLVDTATGRVLGSFFGGLSDRITKWKCGRCYI